MAAFVGKWKVVDVVNLDAFNEACFGDDHQEDRELFTRVMGSLDCEEHIRINGNKLNAKIYLKGKFVVDINSIFDVEETKTDLFGALKSKLRLIGNHVLEKREVYSRYPFVVITQTVDGDKLIVRIGLPGYDDIVSRGRGDNDDCRADVGLFIKETIDFKIRSKFLSKYPLKVVSTTTLNNTSHKLNKTAYHWIKKDYERTMDDVGSHNIIKK
ncbi:hypothetical protein LSH36_863g00026 [Paralvinella palmiformis]|uniref:Uncharacterized protein n=1 Tax=Paralvinella palmiformis TaxID=53620 RepID=A0AAD9IYI2_9ANNE|nr:hypothetical protein LSH36_863g00026 [Paralvinella palmiformis]